MSRSLTRRTRSRAHRVLLCGLALAPLAACHPHASGAFRLPAPERPGPLAHRGLDVSDAAAPGAARVDDLLATRFPGVDVIRGPGGGFTVRIRGGRPGAGEPLLVVDGTLVAVDPREGLQWLNPLDIARIEVLRDASATAVYGPRGASGVVLITTKWRR